MNQAVYPHILCVLCMPTARAQKSHQLDTDADHDGVCQACGCSIEEGRAIQQAAKQVTTKHHMSSLPSIIVIGMMSNKIFLILQDSVVQRTGTSLIHADPILDSLNTSQFDDAMSRIMVKLWEGETDDLTDLLKLLVCI